MNLDLELYSKPIKGAENIVRELTTKIAETLNQELSAGVPLYNMVFDCYIVEEECELTVHRITGESELTEITYPLSNTIFQLSQPSHLFKDIATSLFYHAVASSKVQKIIARIEKKDGFNILLPVPYYEIQERRQAVSYEYFHKIHEAL